MSTRVPLDQFFTPDSVALDCVRFFKKVSGWDGDCYEPMAGGGAFTRAFAAEGYTFEAWDIEPQSEEVGQADFWEERRSLSDFAVISNPPFGYRNADVYKYMDKSAELGAPYIGLLALRYVSRPRFQNRINRQYELLDELLLDTHFLGVDGKNNTVNFPTSFQVWKRMEEGYSRPLYTPRWIAPTKWDEADFWLFKTAKNRTPLLLSQEELMDPQNFTARVPHPKATGVAKEPFILNGEHYFLSRNALALRLDPSVSIATLKQAAVNAKPRSAGMVRNLGINLLDHEINKLMEAKKSV